MIGFKSPHHQGFFNAKHRGVQKAIEANPYPLLKDTKSGDQRPSQARFEYLDGVREFNETQQGG